MLAEQIGDLVVVLRADRLPARTWVRLLEARPEHPLATVGAAGDAGSYRAARTAERFFGDL
jgi:hypothetical protein